MKKNVSTNALRIRLIRALQKEGKKLHKVKCGEWLIIHNNEVTERNDSIEVLARKYKCIKDYEEHRP
ncbi:hypothetical protein N3S92_004254 [Cronobacter sakazakii]|nr:hypothetical protein [Cronobacter sakazakii]KAB0886873.1 hypothetical protein FZI56_21505 [Cronobacter sakazakii]